MEIGKVKSNNGFNYRERELDNFNWQWTSSEEEDKIYIYIYSKMVGIPYKVGCESKNSLVIYNRIWK